MKVFIAVAVISFLSTGVNAGPVGSCALQKPCLTWTMEKDTVCGSTDPCSVKVCMTVDTDSEFCTKAGATVSHVCNKGDEDGCVLPNEMWAKKENVTSGEKFCQVGVPLQTLSFIAKDGADKSSDAGENTYTIPVCGTDVTLKCQQVEAAGIEACGGGKNNLMERVWKFTIPEDVCTCFDEEVLEEVLPDGLVKLIVQHNKPPSNLPYFYADVDVNEDGTTETLDTYCISTAATIYSLKAYCTYMIPYYDTATLAPLTGVPDEGDLDLVTCILNNFEPNDVMDDGGTLTRGSIQKAIWSIMGTGPGNGTEGPYSQVHIDQMIFFATRSGSTCVDYKPPCDGVVGVVLYPYDCYNDATGCTNCNPTPTSNAQPLIAQAQIATLDNVCGAECMECFPPSTRRMLAGKVVKKKKPHWLRG